MAKYRKDSKEFKLQAEKLVVDQGYSYDQIAKQLGTTGWSVLTLQSFSLDYLRARLA